MKKQRERSPNRFKSFYGLRFRTRMEKEEAKPLRCVHCDRELVLGVDAVMLETGVVGPRGFVPLDERKFFCDEDCLENHLSDEDVVRLPRRVP